MKTLYSVISILFFFCATAQISVYEYSVTHVSYTNPEDSRLNIETNILSVNVNDTIWLWINCFGVEDNKCTLMEEFGGYYIHNRMVYRKMRSDISMNQMDSLVQFPLLRDTVIEFFDEINWPFLTSEDAYSEYIGDSILVVSGQAIPCFVFEVNESCEPGWRNGWGSKKYFYFEKETMVLVKKIVNYHNPFQNCLVSSSEFLEMTKYECEPPKNLNDFLDRAKYK